MQFLMLVCGEPMSSATAPTEADQAAAPDTEAWWQATHDSGNYVLGDRLRPAADAVTVRVRGGERLVTDGPYIEGSGVVVGFDVLECDSMEQAVEIVSGHTMAYAGAIELRAVWPFEG